MFFFFLSAIDLLTTFLHVWFLPPMWVSLTIKLVFFEIVFVAIFTTKLLSRLMPFMFFHYEEHIPMKQILCCYYTISKFYHFNHTSDSSIVVIYFIFDLVLLNNQIEDNIPFPWKMRLLDPHISAKYFFNHPVFGELHFHCLLIFNDKKIKTYKYFFY